MISFFGRKTNERAGATPLNVACKQGNVDVVRALVDHPGIDLNRGSPRSTPLFLASNNGYAEVVEVLLALPQDRKLNVNQVATARYLSLSGASPLWVASMYGHVEVVRALLKDPRVDPNIQADRGDTALVIAAFRRRIDVVNTLLNCPKVDITYEDRMGDTALDKALKNGNTDIQSAIESRFDSRTYISQTC